LIAADYGGLAKQVVASHAKFVAELRGEGGYGHDRQPEALAYILTGIELLASLALSTGALDDAGADQLRDKARTAVRELGRLQNRANEEADPAERYMTVLRSMLATGKASLKERRGTKGLDEFVRGDDVIGWFDDQYAYLDPVEARRQVVLFCGQCGETFSTSAKELHNALAEKKYIIPAMEGDEKKNEVKICGLEGPGTRPRVLRVPVRLLVSDRGEPDAASVGNGNGQRARLKAVEADENIAAASGGGKT
jgi:hypothetical protein